MLLEYRIPTSVLPPWQLHINLIYVKASIVQRFSFQNACIN